MNTFINRTSSMRGKDSNLRPPAYEAGELPTALPRNVYVAKIQTLFEFTNYLSKKFFKKL